MVRCYCALALALLCMACALTDPDAGTGPITLSPGVQSSFQEYLARDAPLYFAVTEDGRGSSYIHCIGGVNCTSSAARLQIMDQCRSHNGGRDCKIYAIGRSIVWRDAGNGATALAGAPPAPELRPSERLVRDCLGGPTPAIRVQKCSVAIASTALAAPDKRGPYYVRARAYEQLGSLPLAERDYRAVLAIDPDHVAARTRLDRLVAPAAAPDQPPTPTP
jgi:hypothetical protein